MRRFEIHDDYSVDGAPIVLAEGVQFSSGGIVVQEKVFSLGYSVMPDGITALEGLLNAGCLVWIDKEEVLAPPAEEDTGKHAAQDPAEVQAIEHLTEEIWDGDPLP